ncbi:MAG: hypothetical protein S4CHLAM102_06040 [Chlamydiia bacterium]|nr:hypothetical protein [Chlamydiia bacterium]
MDFSYYNGLFHDGSILDISHNGKQMILSMCSAELDEEDNRDNLPLDSADRIMGKLHIDDIGDIQVDEQKFAGVLKKEYDSGRILRLNVKENSVYLFIQWCNFPLSLKEEDYNSYLISGKRIWWENLPHLVE